MRITKVYTRTGDKGRTRLAGGQSVWKDAERVEAYGTVDELNAAIGVVRAWIGHASTPSADTNRLDTELHWMQNKLFDAGSLLATATGQTFKNMPVVSDADTKRLERLMDECQKDLEPLKEFVLPGGGMIGALLHQARTICRRAERICVGLAREEDVDPRIIRFLNRLSDALFVLARWIARKQGHAETLWQRG